MINHNRITPSYQSKKDHPRLSHGMYSFSFPFLSFPSSPYSPLFSQPGEKKRKERNNSSIIRHPPPNNTMPPRRKPRHLKLLIIPRLNPRQLLLRRSTVQPHPDSRISNEIPLHASTMRFPIPDRCSDQRLVHASRHLVHGHVTMRA